MYINQQVIGMLVVVATVLANIALAMFGFTGSVACSFNEAQAQFAAAAEAWW